MEYHPTSHRHRVFSFSIWYGAHHFFFLKSRLGEPPPPPKQNVFVCLFDFHFSNIFFTSLLEAWYTKMVHLPQSPFTGQFFQMTTFCFGVHGI
jgi:hypothetical protein